MRCQRSGVVDRLRDYRHRWPGGPSPVIRGDPTVRSPPCRGAAHPARAGLPRCGGGCAPDDYHRLFVSPEALERQLATLRRWGYRFVTFSELVDRIDAGGGRGHVAMTFDDGFADNLNVLVPAAPPARRDTVFAVSGWLGKPHPHAPAARILAPDELREPHAASVEIGGHTVTHADLSRAATRPRYRNSPIAALSSRK